MQGWRISMEDAHACVLDLKPQSETDGKITDEALRTSFFGVYDGHGGDKVALYTGENLHKILAKQTAFHNRQFEQALKDTFLATDRAILAGKDILMRATALLEDQKLTCCNRPKVRRRSLRLYRFCRRSHPRQNLLRKKTQMLSACN